MHSIDRLTIRSFCFCELSEVDWSAFFDLSENLFLETNPGEPFPDRTLRRHSLLNPHPLWQFHDWAAIQEGRWLGHAGIYFQREDTEAPPESRTISQLELFVRLEQRRQGIGGELFQVARQTASQLGKTAFLDSTSLEPGKDFLLHRGARVLNLRSTSRLRLESVDWPQLTHWRQEGQQRSPGAVLRHFQIMPEEILDEYVALYNAICQSVPDADAEGFVQQDLTSRKDRHATEKLVGEKGITYLTLLTQEPDGRLSGLTEIYHNPAQSLRVEQSITGVLPAYRRRGLGKWLKAEMLEAVRERLPQASYVETGNAEQNEAMLTINRALGFQPYRNELQYRLNFGT
jgi:mycothiol synthase